MLRRKPQSSGGPTYKKLASVGATVLALGGFGLASTLPTASARRVAHDCTYVEGACPAGYSVTIGAKTTPVGTVIGPGIIVTSVSPAFTVLDDHGQSITVPHGSVVTAASNGTLLEVKNSKSNSISTVTIIGGKVSKIYVQTVKGVNFGYKFSAAAILKNVHYYSSATKRARGTISGVNSYQGKLGFKLRSPSKTAKISLATKALRFTLAEKRYIISHKVRNALATLKITTTAGKLYSFKIRIPISKLTLATMPKKTVHKKK